MIDVPIPFLTDPQLFFRSFSLADFFGCLLIKEKNQNPCQA